MTHEMKLPNGDVIREGEYGRTRDGRKVGPIRLARDASYTSYRWTELENSRGIWNDKGEDGNVPVCQEGNFDIIAAWRDETATPTLWRDMTPEEKGALLLAHHEGKVIEYRLFGDDAWLTIGNPTFGDAHAYRVRPEPKRETVTQYWERERNNSFHTIREGDTHRITFDLIDGQPDCASIRMEAIE